MGMINWVHGLHFAVSQSDVLRMFMSCWNHRNFMGFSVSSVLNVRKNSFFLFCKMRVNYCGLHQILVSCRKKVFVVKWPKFFRQTRAWTWCAKKAWGTLCVDLSLTSLWVGNASGPSRCNPHTAYPPASTWFFVDAARAADGWFL